MVDGRSDQYSLACTLYEMLIGQPPFTGPSSHAVIARHSLEPVPSLRVVRQTVPPAVEGAIMQAMAKLPADRFASMQRFLDALESPESWRRSGPTLPGRRGPAGRGAWAGELMAALGAGLLVAAAAWWLVAGRAASPATPARARSRAVAVLPFQDLASNPDSSYLGAGNDGGAHRRSGPDRLA